jgi:hypothetical protein
LYHSFAAYIFTPSIFSSAFKKTTSLSSCKNSFARLLLPLPFAPALKNNLHTLTKAFFNTIFTFPTRLCNLKLLQKSFLLKELISIL